MSESSLVNTCTTTNVGVCLTPELDVPRELLLREIQIIPLNYGYNVRIGCQTVAVESIDKLITQLSKYLRDPQAFEKVWMSSPEKKLE